MATRQSQKSSVSQSSRLTPALDWRHLPPSARRANHLAPFIKITPVIVLLIGIMLPVEVRVNIGNQTLYAYRIAWMLFAPWIVYSVLKGRFQYRFIDLLVLLVTLWIILSFALVEGLARGLPAGISVGLDILIPYLITRHVIRTPNDFRCMLIVLAPAALLISCFMVIEAITHERFIRSSAEALFGAIGEAEYGDVSRRIGDIDVRYGLARAMGPFSHPILAGLFFAGLMPLYYFSRLRGWPLIVGLASGIGAVFSLSSAALIGIGMFVALAVVDRLRRSLTFVTWPMVLAAIGASFAVLQVTSQGGLVSFLVRNTMNPASGYYRILIWEYGTLMVKRRPLFGSGYAPFEGLFWMGDSVDTIWLAIAIRNGLPAAALMALAVLLAIIGVSLAASRAPAQNQTTLIGIAITLTMFFILGFTVSFFGGMFIWLVMVLAIATTFGQIVPPRKLPRPRRMRRPYSAGDR